jgi:hypothetical protein
MWKNLTHGSSEKRENRDEVEPEKSKRGRTN